MSRHIVLHMHRAGDTPFLHECRDSRLVRHQDGPEQIVSVLMTAWAGQLPEKEN